MRTSHCRKENIKRILDPSYIPVFSMMSAYSNWITTSLDRSMSYTEYIAENTNIQTSNSIVSNISYSEYVAEKIK